MTTPQEHTGTEEQSEKYWRRLYIWVVVSSVTTLVVLYLFSQFYSS